MNVGDIDPRLSFVLLVCLAAGCATRAPSAVWMPGKEFTQSDRQEIIELARVVGFPQIARVKANPVLPGPGTYYEAASASVFSGNRLTWSTLHVCKVANVSGCENRAKGEPMLRMGRWTTSVGCIGQEERWRVRDGGWHLDVELKPGVEYDVATVIVLAIRRRTLVNRLWEREDDHPLMTKLQGAIPDVDASEIVMIQNSRDLDAGFAVRIGTWTGYYFHVRVIDGRVELHRFSRWIT